MSANRPGFIMVSGLYKADQVIFDLENAVPIDKKFEARYMLQEAIAFKEDKIRNCMINSDEIEVAVRINAVDGPFASDDLNIVVPARPDVVRVPMVNSEEDVVYVDEIITELERKNGLPVGKIKIHPMVETPRSLLNLEKIVQASNRIDAIAIGGEDLCQNSGITKSSDWKEMYYARASILNVAQANKIDVIDTVYMDFKDIKGFMQDTKRSFNMGFTGRAVIHPSQIRLIENVLSENEVELEEAEKLAEEILYTEIDGRYIWVIRNKIVSDETYLYQIFRILKRYKKVEPDYLQFKNKYTKGRGEKLNEKGKN